jgi:hypothetical protein
MTEPQPKYVGDWLKYEEENRFSRDVVTLNGGTKYTSGSVLGKITATGKYAMYDNTAVDGREVAAGLLVDATDATGGDALGVIVNRIAELNPNNLTWHANNNAAAKTAGLADLLAIGIVSLEGA